MQKMNTDGKWRHSCSSRQNSQEVEIMRNSKRQKEKQAQPYRWQLAEKQQWRERWDRSGHQEIPRAG